MKRKGRPPPNIRQKGVFPGNLLNGECSSTIQPPLLRWRENSILPARCAPHVFAVFDKDILHGIADQQLPLAGPMGVDQQTPNSLPSDEHLELHFEANETECGPVSVVVVKGRLRENIAFWRSIGASQWLLNVLCEGYCLPFVDFPAIEFFPNHKSALCHAEFVSVEISKLLVSGAIVEVLSADLRVCNPLGVAVNSSGKPRLILDLRYVNQHLRSCKFKYEDVRTAADLFHKGDWFFQI